eukprot:3614648-Pyramimonas_sp.AAC.1
MDTSVLTAQLEVSVFTYPKTLVWLCTPRRIKRQLTRGPVLRTSLQVLGVVAIMVIYWWYVLVPNARVNLAVNKKKGNLRQYLAELKQDDSRGLER